MNLPKYWCTDATPEVYEAIKKHFNHTFDFTYYYEYVWQDGAFTYWGEYWLNRAKTKDNFYNKDIIYITTQQFMEAIEEFKRWDIVIDSDWDEVEFITYLWEEDDSSRRYVIKYYGEYMLIDSITKKHEPTDIEKAIELLTREWKIKDGKILV